MRLAWIWREGGRRNLLMARRLSVDYMLLKYSISEKRSLSCDTRVRYCDELGADMVTKFLFQPSPSFLFGVPAVARDCDRAGCTN